MRLLLDTHILVWLVDDSPRLSVAARQALKSAQDVHVSSISLWEIAIKSALGKLQIDQDLLDAEIELIGAKPLAVTAAHARAVRDLPLIHTDPFDRMLIAQAMSEPLHFVTHNTALRAYSDLVMVV